MESTRASAIGDIRSELDEDPVSNYQGQLVHGDLFFFYNSDGRLGISHASDNSAARYLSLMGSVAFQLPFEGSNDSTVLVAPPLACPPVTRTLPVVGTKVAV